MLAEFLKSIPILLFFVLFAFTFWLIRADKNKKRKLSNLPKITVIVPCYNDSKYIENTIKSIVTSYDDIDLIVINDKSTDNSRDVILNMQKQYSFKFIDNEKNLWKVRSLNYASDFAKSNFIFFVDSDTIVNKEAFLSVLERFEENNVAAVSCPNKIITRWLLALMQQIEYNLIALLRYPANVTSCLSLWWSFLWVKKEAFFSVWKFSESAITEDQDLALKLNEKWYEVKQTHKYVYTNCPNTLKALFKQKLRWMTWGIQWVLSHLRIVINHPIYITYIFIYLLIIVFMFMWNLSDSKDYLSLYNFFKYLPEQSWILDILNEIVKKHWEFLFTNIWFRILYLFYAIPLVYPIFKDRRNILIFLLIFPYTLLYVPMMSLIWILALMQYIFKVRKFKIGDRLW